MYTQCPARIVDGGNLRNSCASHAWLIRQRFICWQNNQKGLFVIPSSLPVADRIDTPGTH